MKKLSMSLILLGMTGLGYGQYSSSEFNNPIFDGFDLPVTNVEYLNEVQDHVTPRYAKFLEYIAPDWDVSKSSKFDGRKDQLFNVTFKSDRGYIVASYDYRGEVVLAREHFRNMALPNQLLIVIGKKYPGWVVDKTSYSLEYNSGIVTAKTYKVKLLKGRLFKRLEVDATGNIMG